MPETPHAPITRFLSAEMARTFARVESCRTQTPRYVWEDKLGGTLVSADYPEPAELWQGEPYTVEPLPLRPIPPKPVKRPAALAFFKALERAFPEPGERVRQVLVSETCPNGDTGGGFEFSIRGVPVYRYLVTRGEGKCFAWILTEILPLRRK